MGEVTLRWLALRLPTLLWCIAGSLQIGNGGTTGTLGTGAVTDNGFIDFARTDGITVPNVISGTGDVGVAAGSVTLTGNNTYSGNTLIDPGTTLQIGNGGTTGTLGTGAVTDNGTLTFNRTDAITVANVISGAGRCRR